MPTPKKTVSILNLKENLKDKYVAFIDVMGFKNLVSKGRVENLETYFSRTIEILDELKAKKGSIESFMISDSIILIAPNTKNDFVDLITAIRRIQSALLMKKILMRGAVSYGQVYYNPKKGIIVGKGYIRAFLLESEAVYPRVIIDPLIVSKIGDDRADFLESINGGTEYNFENRLLYVHRNSTRLTDDAIFIDYANKIIKREKIVGATKTLEMIKENLYAEQALYSKYAWLRDYFYETIKLTHEVLSETSDSESSRHEINLLSWLDSFDRL